MEQLDFFAIKPVCASGSLFFLASPPDGVCFACGFLASFFTPDVGLLPPVGGLFLPAADVPLNATHQIMYSIKYVYKKINNYSYKQQEIKLFIQNTALTLV